VTTSDHQHGHGGTLPLPEADERIPATPPEDIDAALATLRGRAAAWTFTDVTARLALLHELIEATLEAAPAWAAAAAEAKGLPVGSPERGEDWGSGPVALLRNLSLLRRTLEDIDRTGRPQPDAIDVRPDGQVTIKVLPADPLDPLLFTGFTGETRLLPGVTAAQAEARMGRIYREGYEPRAEVALVLGAGNVSSIPPMDALYQLFVLDRVVLLKMNRVNEHLGPHLGEALAPLVRDGFLRIVYGGHETGRYLTDHDEVDTIHVTGSDRTYDAIVFGDGEEGRQRKAREERRIDTPVSAELGNITPIIVVPGPWSTRDLAYQGENIASMLVHNAGFNCVAGRLIVQHRAWSKRRALLEAIRTSFRSAGPRPPYYPGARERWERFRDAYGHAEVFGPEDGDAVPYTLIPELEPDGPDLAFASEAFCAVMGEVALDAPRSVPEYLGAAVRFCNEQVWGDLAVTVLVHPRSMKDPLIAEAVERAIDDLAYGTVVVNHFPGAAYAFVSPPWGAYPGNTPEDIGSGVGFVHNTYLLEDVQKSVVRGPFRPPVTPLWFHTNAALSRVAPELAEVVATGSKRALPRLLAGALRG
jgi:hypothetical protein